MVTAVVTDPVAWRAEDPAGGMRSEDALDGAGREDVGNRLVLGGTDLGTYKGVDVGCAVRPLGHRPVDGEARRDLGAVPAQGYGCLQGHVRSLTTRSRQSSPGGGEGAHPAARRSEPGSG